MGGRNIAGGARRGGIFRFSRCICSRVAFASIKRESLRTKQFRRKGAAGTRNGENQAKGEHAHFMSQPDQAESAAPRQDPRITLTETRFDERLQEAIQGSVDHLLSLQTPDGYWVGELEADTTLESDYIFFLYVLGKLDSHRCAKLANYIRRRQLPDGGWNIYHGGPSELNATVKAYVALKLAGDSPAASHMARARCQIHELGGVEATNSYTRLYLALGNVLPWSYVPAIPPELMLVPDLVLSEHLLDVVVDPRASSCP